MDDFPTFDQVDQRCFVRHVVGTNILILNQYRPPHSIDTRKCWQVTPQYLWAYLQLKVNASCKMPTDSQDCSCFQNRMRLLLVFWWQGGKEARRQGGKEARRQGGKEARRQGGKEARSINHNVSANEWQGR
jgi:hypothetical protein